VDFSGRKSATKLLCAKTFSGKVVRHSLAYLTVLKWLVADVLFYLTKVTHPLKTATSNQYLLIVPQPSHNI